VIFLNEDVEQNKISGLLKYPGIGKITIQKLEKAGILNINDLLLFNPEEIMEKADIDIEKALHILKLARRILGRQPKVLKAIEYEQVMNSREFITTGVASIDSMLGGGIFVWDIYEFAGEYGSGKTQLCHQLAVAVQLSREKGGLESASIYIDTEGTFSPKRIRDIARKFKLNVRNVLENIFVFRPINVSELEDVVTGEIRDIVRNRVKLVIVDSIIALYRAEFKGREWLARRQQRINYLIDWLKRYAHMYNIAVVYTNQVLSQPVPWGATLKIPAGGNIIAHAATHRFILRSLKEKWHIECIDSPRIPKGSEACFKITWKGLEDI